MWCWFRDYLPVTAFKLPYSRYKVLDYKKIFSLMRRALFSSWLSALALALSLSTQAAEWSVEPNISLVTNYNDNIRLTAADHDSVWKTTFSPSVRLGVARANQGLFGNAGFSIQRFSGGSGSESSNELNRENYSLITNAYHRTERDIFSGNINYTRADTLDSELDETGNVALSRASRNRFSLGSSWGRVISEKISMNLSYQFSTAKFTGVPGRSVLVQSDSTVFSSSLVRQLTPRMQGTLSASISSFEPETGFDSSTINIQAGISRNFSETLMISFLAGQRETTFDTFFATGFCIGAEPGATFPECDGGTEFITGTAKNELKNSGSVFSTNITKILESGSISASLSRSSSPSSNGELLDTTRLILSGEHRFSERLRSNLTIEYNERETIINRIGLESSQGSSTLFRIRPGISWRWSREWGLAGQYEYVKNKNALSGTATRNALYLTLNYRPTKISLSR